MAWGDAEHRLQGQLSTQAPRVGEPFSAMIKLETLDGPPHLGPITFTLRPVQHLPEQDRFHVEASDEHDVGQIVTSMPDAGVWAYTLTPSQRGLHIVEISFHAGRRKVLVGLLECQASRVPSWLGPALGLGAVVVAVSMGINLLRRQEMQRPS